MSTKTQPLELQGFVKLVRWPWVLPRWKGEPNGDGTRLESGRAQALRVRLPPLPPCRAGFVQAAGPLPSKQATRVQPPHPALIDVASLAERSRHRLPRPDRRVR